MKHSKQQIVAEIKDQETMRIMLILFTHQASV